MRISELKAALTKTSTLLGAALLVAGLGLAGCGGDTASEPTSGASPTGSAASSTPVDGSGVTVSDAWVKATDTEMTGLFATFTNTTDQEVTIVSATSPAAPMVELHEVVTDDAGSMKMQPKEGGFVIAAGEDYTLAPGGDHIMLMGLKKALKAGDEIPVTLLTKDGTEIKLTAVIKPFTGADESYAPGASSSASGDMDHSQ